MTGVQTCALPICRAGELAAESDYQGAGVVHLEQIVRAAFKELGMIFCDDPEENDDASA